MNDHIRHLLCFLCLPRSEKRLYLDQWPRNVKYAPAGSGPTIADPFLALIIEAHDEIERALPFSTDQSKQLLEEMWGLLGAMLYFRRLDVTSDYWWRNEVSNSPNETQLSILWRVVERLSLSAIDGDSNIRADQIPPISEVLHEKLTII
jgi:hypothetical protein